MSLDEVDDDGDNEEGPQISLVGIRYTIVRLPVKMAVKHVPQSFLRAYLLYNPWYESLCNVGGCGIALERRVLCTIVDYVPLGEVSEDEHHVRTKSEGVVGAECCVPIKRGQRRRSPCP